MGKDPAVLFYYQDFIFGTQFMSDEEVGQYVRILCQQYDRGHLPPKLVQDICKASAIPQKIADKLLVDESGFYYNERADKEKERRVKFTTSRKMNAQASAQHMETVNENINIKDKYFENVFLTKDEFKRLVTEYGEQTTDKAIKYLSDYKIEKNYKTKDDNRTLRRWVFDAVKERENKYGKRSGNSMAGLGQPKEYKPDPKPTDAEIERNKKRLGELTKTITHPTH